MRNTLLLCSLVSLNLLQTAHGQSEPSAARSKRRLPAGFIAKSLHNDENGQEYKYAIFIPPQHKLDPQHKWPIILFLHGSGECGEDGLRQTTVGLPVYISQHASQFPFIVVMPQAHAMWFRGAEAFTVWRAMADTVRDYPVDLDRVYITGLSMGGFGAWELAASQPDAFAAIVPICGAAPLEYLSNIAHIPVWAFHGAQDNHVSVNGSRDAIAVLRKLGGPGPKYTEYPALSHECWDQAYSEPDLWRWLLAQRRKIPRVIDFRIPGGASRVWWIAIKADDHLKGPAWVHAEIAADGQINVQTEGISTWGLVSDREPLKPGTEIQLNWNGQVVYRGTFNGSLSVNPSGVHAATSHPSSEPAAPTGARP